jgi:hypothetical protein
VIAGVEVGLALFLAGVLVTAGAAKLLNLELTRTSLGRLLGKGRRADRRLVGAAAAGLGTGEGVLGVVLVIAPTRAVPALAATALCVGFVIAVRRARRLGAACGCFGSLSLRVSGPVEQARAVALLGVSGLLAVLDLTGAGGPVAIPGIMALPGIAVGLFGAALVTVVSMAVAAKARTVRDLRALLLPPRTGWRPAGFLARRRILRTVRALDDVRDVERYLGRPVPWWRANIRVTGRATVASVVVVDGDVRMHVVLPRRGEAAVLGQTPRGVVTPAMARSGSSGPPVRTGG